MKNAVMRVSDGKNKIDISRNIKFIKIYFNPKGDEVEWFELAPGALYKLLKDFTSKGQNIGTYSLKATEKNDQPHP